MTRTSDLVLVWTLKNRAWIDQCFQFFAGLDPLWRREPVGESDHLFRFVHTGAPTDPLPRRLPPHTEIRVAASASHDLRITVSPVSRNPYELLSAYEVANRIGASHAPYPATGIMGAQCRAAFLVPTGRRGLRLVNADVEPLMSNELVRPVLTRALTAQRRQLEQRGYATIGDPVLFFHDDPDAVVAVDADLFARDPQPGPREVHGAATAPSRHRVTRMPPRPLVTQLLEARPAWLTDELAASASQLRLFVNTLQDKGSAATKVHLGDPTRPGTECVTLPIYVPLTDDADGELAVRLQRVTRFAETAERRLRRRCGTCKRSSIGAPPCTRSRSTALTRSLLSVTRGSTGTVADANCAPQRSRTWSCGRCQSVRFEEDTIFLCPSCRGFVSRLDALDGCPHCGLTPD